MEGLKFKINAKSFYQTNSEQAYELYKIASDFAGLTGNELVYDLYTGTGTIAQFVAKQAKKVIGVVAVSSGQISSFSQVIKTKKTKNRAIIFFINLCYLALYQKYYILNMMSLWKHIDSL